MNRLLLDGGMGSALLAAGLPAGALPEHWLVERPEQVARVHADHARAGADVVLTCTFNLASPRLRDAGLRAPLPELARRAAEIARAAAPRAHLAGSLGPTGLAGRASRAELRERYAEACAALAAAGVELLWIESQWDLEEARTAEEAARGAGLPTVVTFTFAERAGALLAASGEPALTCLEAVAAGGAAAVGANCSLPGAPLAAALECARARLEVPLVAKPSAGLPAALVEPEPWATWLSDLGRAGATWLGGCCGAGPEHLAALRRVLGR